MQANVVIPKKKLRIPPNVMQNYFTLTVSNPKAIIPAGTSWKPKGILHTLGLLAKEIPTPSGRMYPSDSRLPRAYRRLTIDEIRKHDADGNHNLEKTGNSSTNIFWRTLGDVGRSNG